MILQSHARFRFSARPVRATSRGRIGMTMLAGVVTLLALLNLAAGVA
jgi:hypothetical protein